MIWRVGVALWCLGYSVLVWSAGGRVLDMQGGWSSGACRFALHLSHQRTPRVLKLRQPFRWVLDLPATRYNGSKKPVFPSACGVKAVRWSQRPGGTWRVVLEGVHSFAPVRDMSNRDPRRLVYRWKAVSRTVKQSAVTRVSSRTKVVRKPFVVAVDAGHGGSDPGAVGPTGVQEKQVTLAIAKRLKRALDADRAFRAVLVRRRDEYVDLRRRMRIARRASADLLISVHADGSNHPQAAGASVYTLSAKGASSEMGVWLAARENRKLMGGVQLKDKDAVLAAVLLDLSQTATLDTSFDVAQFILKELSQVTVLHQSKVQRAGFMVLKSPDLPSLLVETNFISHPRYERRLGSASYQHRLAQAIYRGVASWHTHTVARSRDHLKIGPAGV